MSYSSLPVSPIFNSTSSDLDSTSSLDLNSISSINSQIKNTHENYFENNNNTKKSKKRTSPVHDYLEIIEGGIRVCKICFDNPNTNELGKWGAFTSLSTISRHFENKHPDTYKDFQRKNTKITYPSYSMTDKIVDDNSFIKYTTNLDLRYKLPCRQTVSTTIKNKFASMRLEIKKILKSNQDLEIKDKVM
ncbi:489_t:CDS:2, partial [Acaulospora morrowiae]